MKVKPEDQTDEELKKSEEHDSENKLKDQEPDVETERAAKSNELTNDQKSTLKRLQERPKRSILIPEDPLNPNDLVVPVSVNGVTYAIPRGKRFEVPDVIADVWEDSYSKTQAANRKIKFQENRDIVITS